MKLHASASNNILDDEGFTFAVVPPSRRLYLRAAGSSPAPASSAVRGRRRVVGLPSWRRRPPRVCRCGGFCCWTGGQRRRSRLTTTTSTWSRRRRTCTARCVPGRRCLLPPRRAAGRTTPWGQPSAVLRWRQRLIIGRSHSDGKEKFVFLNAGSSSGSEHKCRGGDEGHDALSYYANGGGRGGGSGGRRRSFLPYKQDLVGLIANSTAFQLAELSPVL
ncbi:hypothetical protein ABZP36_030961, partial [Zizania latifolia]